MTKSKFILIFFGGLIVLTGVIMLLELLLKRS
jgi:hypothetical protein